MSIFSAAIKPNEFDPKKDKIAVMIKSFTLKKKSERFQKYSEPYIVSIALAQNQSKELSVEFRSMPFPKTRKNEKVTMGGDGYQVYGPANPGEYLAYSILFMESDQDVREAGAKAEEILKSELVKDATKVALIANPSAAATFKLVTGLSNLIADQMKKNKDDELYRLEGTLLRDVMDEAPFNIRELDVHDNDFIEIELSILPLKSSDRHRKRTKSVTGAK